MGIRKYQETKCGQMYLFPTLVCKKGNIKILLKKPKVIIKEYKNSNDISAIYLNTPNFPHAYGLHFALDEEFFYYGCFGGYRYVYPHLKNRREKYNLIKEYLSTFSNHGYWIPNKKLLPSEKENKYDKCRCCKIQSPNVTKYNRCICNDCIYKLRDNDGATLWAPDIDLEDKFEFKDNLFYRIKDKSVQTKIQKNKK